MLYLSSTYASKSSFFKCGLIYCTWLTFHIMVSYKCICVFLPTLSILGMYISCKLTFSHHPMLVSYKCINVFDLPVLIQQHFPILKTSKSSSLDSFPNFWKVLEVYVFEFYLFSQHSSPLQIRRIWWLQESGSSGLFGWIIRWVPLVVSHHADHPHRTGSHTLTVLLTHTVRPCKASLRGTNYIV